MHEPRKHAKKQRPQREPKQPEPKTTTEAAAGATEPRTSMPDPETLRELYDRVSFAC
ncbi:MAG: hypothetical protein ACXVEF_38905 [Polyangiales bacterium]